MGLFLTVLAVCALGAGLVALGRRVRRRGIGDVVAGPVDEIWRPATHRTRQEIRARQEQQAPDPSAGGRP